MVPVKRETSKGFRQDIQDPNAKLFVSTTGITWLNGINKI